MKILVTGNLGYVGPSVVSHLRLQHPEAYIVGMDLGFFSHSLTGVSMTPENALDCQMFKDVRDVVLEDLVGFDAVVHLAAISNDPMGNSYERVTDEVNCQSSVKIASLAKIAGVTNYVFASSCSVYGEASGVPKKEEDETNPLTAYAKSKIDTEIQLESFASDDFIVTCLRFATACGFSARTRLDLVLNDFVAGAMASGRIDILSDGTPWRPLIHVSDMARAIDWAISRTQQNGGEMLIVNTGSDEWNYQVRDLAEAVALEISGTKVDINLDAAPDRRSYKVDFEKFKYLAPDYQPMINLKDAIIGLKEGLLSMKFADKDFRNSDLMRLNVLNGHMMASRIDGNLNWIHK